MDLTVDGALALAPDAAAAAAGKKLARPGSWQGLGRSDTALWGECQGSALYQARVDLSDLTAACSCPSRKLPCKHSLGLLLLAAGSPDALPVAEPPEWVAAWLARRAAAAAKRAGAPAAATDTAPAPKQETAARSTRPDKRAAAVAAGLDALDLWLDDLVRGGLASVDTQPAAFWERQAARLVDAQAPGVAARLRRLAGIPHASPDWPARLLAALGRLALLTEAYRRLDALDPALQEDVRAAIGWTLKEAEVAARGEAVADNWIAVGQYTYGEDRLRVRRAWLLGTGTRRAALVLQFAAGSAPFPATLPPGACQQAELSYWPSAYSQRALIRARHDAPTTWRGTLPGAASLEEFLAEVARATARQPWLDRILCVLNGAVPLLNEADRWFVRDRAGCALPLVKGEHWDLLALSGGHPVDLAAEWDGDALRPLSVVADNVYYPLNGGQ